MRHDDLVTVDNLNEKRNLPPVVAVDEVLWSAVSLACISLPIMILFSKPNCLLGKMQRILRQLFLNQHQVLQAVGCTSRVLSLFVDFDCLLKERSDIA